MTTWVRYSVAVYMGLLLAGAVVVPEPLAAAGGWLRLTDAPPEARVITLDNSLLPHQPPRAGDDAMPVELLRHRGTHLLYPGSDEQ